MTKVEIIARYGQAYYDAFLEASRQRAKARYDAGLRTPQSKINEAVRRHRAKPENAAKHNAYNRAYMAAQRAAMTPEERKALDHERWLRIQARRQRDPAFDAAFKAQAKARHDAWREANREHVNASSRAWRAANREYVRTVGVVQAARRRNGGKIDREFVAWLREQPCVDCGSTERIEVGHIIPVRGGGTNDPINLIPQCRPCNRRLSSKPHRLASENS